MDSSSYYMTGSASTSFDGESEITTAIDYVVSDDLPVIYALTGHGEAELSTTFSDSIEKANIETTDFSLLNVDEIPEDADLILINAPSSDISDEELTMLKEYVENGGHLLVMSGPLEENSSLPNLNSIIESLGVTINEGIVVEGNRDNYAFAQPYILLPNIESSDITDALIDEKSNVIVPISSGLTIGSSSAVYSVTSLLTTSEDAFSKIAGYSLDTYEKEDGDIDGPFSLAVSASSQTSDGKIIWIASGVMLDDGYNSYSSGANVDFVMNSISWMIGEEDTISIRSKSLDYNYLTISETAAKRIKIIMIGVLPIGYLLYGLEEVFRRRKEGMTVEA
jgi:ABC-2 type transport system permease protein